MTLNKNAQSHGANPGRHRGPNVRAVAPNRQGTLMNNPTTSSLLSQKEAPEKPFTIRQPPKQAQEGPKGLRNAPTPPIPAAADIFERRSAAFARPLPLQGNAYGGMEEMVHTIYKDLQEAQTTRQQHADLVRSMSATITALGEWRLRAWARNRHQPTSRRRLMCYTYGL